MKAGWLRGRDGERPEPGAPVPLGVRRLLGAVSWGEVAWQISRGVLILGLAVTALALLLGAAPMAWDRPLSVALAALLVGWGWRVQPALRHNPWDRRREYPKRRGASLLSVSVAMGIIAMCLTLVAQGYTQGSRAHLAQARRLAALAACQEQIERLRAGAPLPAEGRGFSVPGHAPVTGSLRVETGPVAGTWLVTAGARWTADGRLPDGEVALSTIMARGGGRR